MDNLNNWNLILKSKQTHLWHTKNKYSKTFLSSEGWLLSKLIAIFKYLPLRLVDQDFQVLLEVPKKYLCLQM